jgi:hypothetical protein
MGIYLDGTDDSTALERIASTCWDRRANHLLGIVQRATEATGSRHRSGA